MSVHQLFHSPVQYILSRKVAVAAVVRSNLKMGRLEIQYLVTEKTCNIYSPQQTPKNHKLNVPSFVI